MKPKEQINFLNSSNIPSFIDKLKDSQQYPLKSNEIDIFQINIGKKCNLKCKHCHVNAGPDRTELMSRKDLELCLKIIKDCDVSTVDITGGAPEMNSNLQWFIESISKLNKRLIVRSNLVILAQKSYKHFIDIYSNNNVELIASLPHYLEERTDKQRGNGTFKSVINIMRQLNDKGYGNKDSDLLLHLVHNPVGAFLPGSQGSLEHDYKQWLKEKYDVVFNTLFCIANMPLGRYLDYLIESDNYEDYMETLVRAYNPCAVENVMCKNTISVAWDGRLYDCDFNQMLNLPVSDSSISHIEAFDCNKLSQRTIVTHNHCFGCTAGSGSSCQGALDE